jgi:hypothetical protein
MSCQESGSGGAGRGPDGGVKFFFTADTTVTAPCRHTLTGSTCTMLHKGASRRQYLLRCVVVHQGSLAMRPQLEAASAKDAISDSAKDAISDNNHHTQGTHNPVHWPWFPPPPPSRGKKWGKK